MVTGEPRREALWLFGPTLLLLAWAVFPLLRGSDTLYLRDVLATHLPMKHAQAEAMAEGRFPVLDPYRAGGQPLAGNPNAVPFYPDNVLYLVAPMLWAFNAHFWLHLLLAAPAMYLLGRAWGLGPRGAWAAGVVWGTSGFFLSQLNYYNLVGGVTLAPALVAAVLRLGEVRPRAGAVPWAGLLAGLLLLSGDPLTAVIAVLAALLALACRNLGAPAPARELPSRGRLAGRLLAVFALGCGVAAPQLYELARVVGGSFRGAYGFSSRAATAASWDPSQLVDWLLPMPFGRLDLLAEGSFWGHRFHVGFPPFYLSLYAGLFALGLVLAAGRPRSRAALWCWLLIALGIFFALGRFNPVATWVFSLPGLRYPLKAWLWVALGAAVLAGQGFERAFDEGDAAARRRLWGSLAALAALLLAAGLWLRWMPAAAETWLQGLMPAGRPAAWVGAERLRLAFTCSATAALAATFALLAWLARRPGRAWAAALLGLHAASQLLLLRPLLSMDAALPYEQPSPLLAQVPDEAVLVHGGYGGLFGPSRLARGTFPLPTAQWLARRAIYELLPPAGALQDRRYLLNTSPEGLDSLQARVTQAAVGASADPERVRLLQATGADLLLLDRELPPAALAAGARELAVMPSFGSELRLYELDRPLFPRLGQDAVFLTRASRAADFNAVFARLTDPAYQPAAEAVLLGPGSDLDGPPGELVAATAAAEGLAAEVSSERGGVLVLRRAYLPLYRAWVDGKPAPTVVANFQLLGVEVPAGNHRVTVGIDRRALVVSVPLSAALAVCLLFLSRLRGRAAGDPTLLDSAASHGDTQEDQQSPDRQPG